MDVTLATVTVISLLLAWAMAIVSWQRVRAERRRGDARVAALLAELAGDPAPRGGRAPGERLGPAGGAAARAAGPARRGHPPGNPRLPFAAPDPAPGDGGPPGAAWNRPPDRVNRPPNRPTADSTAWGGTPHPARARDGRARGAAEGDARRGLLDPPPQRPARAVPAAPPRRPRPAASAGPGARLRWGHRLAAVAVATVVVAGVSLADRAALRRDGEAAPVELLSLDHRRQGDYLTVSGSLRNPPAGRERTKLSVTATSLDRTGAIIGTGQTPLPVAALPPGGETAFTIALPDADLIGRYRVSFMEDRSKLPHVDRRGTDAASAAGTRP